MKLPAILGASVVAAKQTSFENAIDHLKTRYKDLGLKRIDEDNALKKSVKKLWKRAQRKYERENQNPQGCSVDKIDYDFSLDIVKRCNAKETLLADARALSQFFSGGKKCQCKKFNEHTENRFASAFNEFFENKETTCEVDLAGAFGSHTSAVGRVVGDVIIFDGIKYGEHQRFARSTPAAVSASNDYSAPSVSCPIASNVLTGATTLPRTTEEDEDCLYLKITAPLSAFENGAEKKKVISWIHGGTFNFGGMDVVYEDPTPLVSEQDLIVVKFNYRLGPFGNWYFPKRVDNQPKSNFGFLDQRLALQWVRDNVAAFGGDDSDITLAGASAGGAAVTMHMTSPDSYSTYDNAMIMSASQVAFWDEADLNFGYEAIAKFTPCANETNFQDNLDSGYLVGCLASIPTETFQQIMTQAGNVFSGISLTAGRLTQLEFTFAPGFDGENFVADPRVQWKAGNYKPDLGFLTVEVTTDEAQSLTNNVFGNDRMRALLFKEQKDVIWQNFNSHIVFPLTAYRGFIQNLFTVDGVPQAVTDNIIQMVHQAFPCPAVMAQLPSQPVPPLTDCIDVVADFINAYLFTCPIEEGFSNGATNENRPDNYHGIVFAASTPGPAPNNADNKPWQQPYEPAFEKCFGATDGMACHNSGARWFFGQPLQQNIELSQAEVEFGKIYRDMYGKLIREGSNSDLADALTAKWTKASIEGGLETVSKPMAQQCGLLGQLDIYGKF